MDGYQLKQTVLSESPVKLQSQFLVYFSFYCVDISSKKPLNSKSKITNYCRSTCGILVNLMWMNDLTLDHVFAQFLLSVQDDLAKTKKGLKAHYKTRWK